MEGSASSKKERRIWGSSSVPKGSRAATLTTKASRCCRGLCGARSHRCVRTGRRISDGISGAHCRHRSAPAAVVRGRHRLVHRPREVRQNRRTASRFLRGDVARTRAVSPPNTGFISRALVRGDSCSCPRGGNTHSSQFHINVWLVVRTHGAPSRPLCVCRSRHLLGASSPLHTGSRLPACTLGLAPGTRGQEEVRR